MKKTFPRVKTAQCKIHLASQKMAEFNEALLKAGITKQKFLEDYIDYFLATGETIEEKKL